MAAKKKRAGKRKVELQVWSVACVVCDTWFDTTSGKAMYCSNACKLKAYRERQK